ncbi:MAG: NAD(P)H-binding protein [Proteobacteria bacterium]|nr:NAD(P)H-binding protein [Pseudomonadota bacterium]
MERISSAKIMNILITGASGFIGKNLVKSLHATKHNITACIHKTELAIDVKTFKIDFAQMLKITDWLPYLRDIDVVINCVGVIAETTKHSFAIMHHQAPVALFKACEKTKVKRVIQISALGADNTAIVNYHKSKKQTDDYLYSSSLAWFILRPSLVFGQGGKSFAWFNKLSNLPLIPLIGNGQQLIQPVDIEVLIKTIVRCLQVKKTNQIIDVVGATSISYKQWMQQLRKQKSKARFIYLPITLMKFIAILLKPLNLQLLSKDNLTMLQQNNVGNYQQLGKFLENKI